MLRRNALEPFAYDIMPPMIHVYEHLLRTGDESPWLRATYSVSVATMYWSRALYMFDRRNPGPVYPPRGETIYWVKPVLRDHPVLYSILAFLPAVTLAALGYVSWVEAKVPRVQKPWEGPWWTETHLLSFRHTL